MPLRGSRVRQALEGEGDGRGGDWVFARPDGTLPGQMGLCPARYINSQTWTLPGQLLVKNLKQNICLFNV